MIRTELAACTDNKCAPSGMSEHEQSASCDENVLTSVSQLATTSEAIEISASDLLTLRVRYQPCQSQVEAASLEELGINRSGSETTGRYSGRAVDEPRLRLSIRLRGKWKIEIGLPGWCGGILTGVLRIRF